MKSFLFIFIFYFSGINCQISLFLKNLENLHREPITIGSKFRSAIDVKYIEQKLDHFNQSDGRTWRMRYMSNSFFLRQDGPIFIFVGGEWEISDGFLRGGHMFDMARDLNGQMFYTEHRFYGRSQPFMQLETANLKYLSWKQALADLAHFIRTIKATTVELKNSKVIIIGASYSGALATWFSKLYPNLVDGVWASSAPIKARAEITEYKEIVGESIRKVGGEACYDTIKTAVAALEELVDNGELSKLQLYLNICPDFNPKDENSVMRMFATISDAFAALVQYQQKGDIEKACKIIMTPDDELEGLGSYIKFLLGGGLECMKVSYEDDVQTLKKTALDGILRQYLYQTCTQIGWYQTSKSENQIFGKKFPLQHYINLCRDIYDMTFDAEILVENMQATNQEFEAREFKNIFYTHGSLDPWCSMGILCNGECGAVVPNYAHCQDFDSISSADSPEMVQLKQTIAALVKKWISHDTNDSEAVDIVE